MDRKIVDEYQGYVLLGMKVRRRFNQIWELEEFLESYWLYIWSNEGEMKVEWNLVFGLIFKSVLDFFL